MSWKEISDNLDGLEFEVDHYELLSFKYEQNDLTAGEYLPGLIINCIKGISSGRLSTLVGNPSNITDLYEISNYPNNFQINAKEVHHPDFFALDLVQNKKMRYNKFIEYMLRDMFFPYSTSFKLKYIEMRKVGEYIYFSYKLTRKFAVVRSGYQFSEKSYFTEIFDFNGEMPVSLGLSFSY